MKHFIWLTAGLIWTGWVGEAHAQFGFYGPGYAKGIGFQYRSKHASVGGFFYKGYSGGFLSSPFVPFGPAYPYYPYGAVNTNVTVNIITPPTIIVAPAKDYDLRGVDLDLVTPEQAFGKGIKVNGVPEPEPPQKFQPKPMPEPPPPQMPGQDISVPKKPVRPDDAPPPQPKFPPKPGAAPDFPKPPAPLPDARDESDRLVALGLEAIKKKEYGTAAKLFKQAAQVDANNFLAYLLLAQAHLAFPRYDPAVQAIHAAMKLNKDYPNVKFQPRLSLFKGMEDEFDDMLDQLKDAVKNNPKSPELLFLLAHQLWFDNQRDAAQALFLKARPLSPDPTYIDIFLNAGKAKILAAK